MTVLTPEDTARIRAIFNPVTDADGTERATATMKAAAAALECGTRRARTLCAAVGLAPRKRGRPRARTREEVLSAFEVAPNTTAATVSDTAAAAALVKSSGAPVTRQRATELRERESITKFEVEKPASSV